MTMYEIDLARALYRYWLNRDEGPDSPEVVAWAGVIAEHGVDYAFRIFSSSPEFHERFVTNPVFRSVLAPSELPDDVVRIHHWHIPKTAGLSVRRSILASAPEDAYGLGFPLGYLKRLSVARLRSIRVFSGHYGQALEELVPRVPWYSATVVRDPVDHAASLYAFQRAETQAGRWGSRSGLGPLALTLSFSDWLRHPEAQAQWVNFQSTFLVSPQEAHTWPATGDAATVEGYCVDGPLTGHEVCARLGPRLETFSLIAGFGDLD